MGPWTCDSGLGVAPGSLCQFCKEVEKGKGAKPLQVADTAGENTFMHSAMLSEMPDSVLGQEPIKRERCRHHLAAHRGSWSLSSQVLGSEGGQCLVMWPFAGPHGEVTLYGPILGLERGWAAEPGAWEVCLGHCTLLP